AVGVRVVPLIDTLLTERLRLAATIGAVTAALVLLIAILNLANLLLARAETRRHELALRQAIGAGHSRLVRQLLTESIVLAAMGSAIGLLVAFGGVQGIAALWAAVP